MLLNENKRIHTLRKIHMKHRCGTYFIQKIVSLFYKTRISIIAEGERKITTATATAKH